MLQTTDAGKETREESTKLPLRLTRMRKEAAQLIRNQIKIGQAIKSQRLNYLDELDQARKEKQEWVTRVSELLNQLFSDNSVADQCNDWVGPILPEYAEFDMFVEAFASEMKHRITRLQELVKKLDEIPEPERPRTIAQLMAQKEQEENEVAMSTLLDSVLTPAGPTASAPEKTASMAPAPSIGSSGLVVLRGGEDASRQGVAQFLQKLSLTIQIIDQRPGQDHKPLVEALGKLERAAFALILNDTPATDADYLFDLGCCVGKFGAGRLVVLQREATPQNGDARGVKHIAIDASGGWMLALAKHLKAGGVSIDMNRLV
jgi:hypothetical protein